MAKYPKAHEQVIAAVFGQCKLEEEMGICRLGEDGWPISTSTPWCLQLEKDLREMGKVSGGCHDMWETLESAPGGLLGLFYEGDVHDQFIRLGLRAMCAASFTVQIPPPGLARVGANGTEAAQDEWIAPPPAEFGCNETVDGTMCGNTFHPFAALQTHRRIVHGAQHELR
eukprot:4218991-Pyramimonas_sp.AAC.1